MPREWTIYKQALNIQTKTESRGNRNSKQMDYHEGTESVIASQHGKVQDQMASWLILPNTERN